jgi:hypothetical protein
MARSRRFSHVNEGDEIDRVAGRSGRISTPIPSSAATPERLAA